MNAMKEEDLIELLTSILEEDAIVSRLYTYFYKHLNYPLELLVSIINFGLEEGFFQVVDTESNDTIIESINWQADNIEQEILMCDENQFMNNLFNNKPSVPEEFQQFILDSDWC